MIIELRSGLFCLIFILFFSESVYCQTINLIPNNKLGDKGLYELLSKKLGDVYIKNKNSLDQCINTVVFAKFNIDTSGNVKGISFSKAENVNDATTFYNLFSSVILASNGTWLPCMVNGIKVPSKSIILPFVIELEAGCNLNDLGVNNYKPVPNYSTLKLQYLFNYENDKTNSNIFQLYCLLLKPLPLFSNK